MRGRVLICRSLAACRSRMCCLSFTWLPNGGWLGVALGFQSVAYRLPTKWLWGGFEMALGGFALGFVPTGPSVCPPRTFQQITSLESGTHALPWPFWLGPGQQRGGQLLVKAEKVLHPLALAGEGLGAVAQIHRPIQLRMGFDQRRRHRERVIQIRQRRRLRGADLRCVGERLLCQPGLAGIPRSA